MVDGAPPGDCPPPSFSSDSRPSSSIDYFRVRCSNLRNEDYRRLSKIFRFFLARNLPNLRQEPSSLVSTSLTHSGDDEDSEDSSRIISLFFCWNLRNLPTESTSEMLASFTGTMVKSESFIIVLVDVRCASVGRFFTCALSAATRRRSAQPQLAPTAARKALSYTHQVKFLCLHCARSHLRAPGGISR